MTTFLTFGVYALRISSDLPVQSEYMPLVSIYFNICILYTLISLIWFAIANYFVDKTRLPKCLKLFAVKIRSILFSRKRVKQMTSQNNEQRHVDDTIIFNLDNLTNKSIIENSKFGGLNSEYLKKLEKKEFDSNLNVLNMFVFLFVFIVMIVSNLIIWLSVAIY